ncbi:hypothetical protein [Gluconobacter sp.]|uniref:hypothetical protein n=1 Tax=Gluconobacter sp. TaxID=1876758 RepID=UPI0039ED6F70
MWITPLQAMRKLDKERRAQFFRVYFGKGTEYFRIVAPDIQKNRIRKTIGLLLVLQVLTDFFSYAPKVLDQDYSDLGRDGPELPDQERPVFLIGVQELAECFRVNMAVRMSHQRPGYFEDPGQPGKGAV